MASFLFYDIIFLILFVAFVSLFLYSRRKNLKKEGLLFLYRTSWGIKLINKVGNKYKKTLKVLSYISVTVGYVLMITMFYLLGKIVYIYVTLPDVVREIKVPPIIPLVPYLPQIFKLDFLPPFFFTYWIVIIAIIAVTHEFAHGIFAAYEKIKIKSTGFGFFPFFLPVFLAAFVELDEKEMEKKKISSQLSILSAGTFANVLTAIFFFFVLIIFFNFAFSPSGVVFNDYVYAPVAISLISSVNGVPLEKANFEEFTNLLNENGSNEIEAEGEKYVGVGFFSNTNEGVRLYYDAPAINANLSNVILSINNIKITSIEVLESELTKYSPEETVTLNMLDKDGEDYDVDVVLGEHIINEGQAWLGIGFTLQQRSGILGKFFTLVSSFKKQNIYYEPKLGDLSLFVYNLLWWLILISISVALVNMLPVGIFDGGRFFYLTILFLTKKEKIARNLFSLSTYLILFIILILMVFWAFSFL